MQLLFDESLELLQDKDCTIDASRKHGLFIKIGKEIHKLHRKLRLEEITGVRNNEIRDDIRSLDFLRRLLHQEFFFSSDQEKKKKSDKIDKSDTRKNLMKYIRLMLKTNRSSEWLYHHLFDVQDILFSYKIVTLSSCYRLDRCLRKIILNKE